VPEYDAFGREIGDDPLAALREATVAVPRADPAVPEAVVAETPEPAPAVVPPRFARPRRRRRGGFIALGAVVALLGVLAAVGNVVVGEIEGGLEAIVQTEEPPGLGPKAMIRAVNLAAAIEQMRASGLGRPVTMRVAPGRVDARLVAGNGRLTLVRVTAGRELRTLAARQSGRGRGIAYAQIDPTVPERLVREAEGRQIRFLRLDRYGWRAYSRDGSVTRGS
jgi:hypothetical protein